MSRGIEWIGHDRNGSRLYKFTYEDEPYFVLSEEEVLNLIEYDDIISIVLPDFSQGEDVLVSYDGETSVPISYTDLFSSLSFRLH